jgi:ASC-1-like (ASCH) protein
LWSAVPGHRLKTGPSMNIIVPTLMAILLLLTSMTAQGESATRVRLRNDARLVQTFEGDTVVFRCEQMLATEMPIRRWIRDCNELAYMELKEMKREGRLAEFKLSRQPLGDNIVNNELRTTLATTSNR